MTPADGEIRASLITPRGVGAVAVIQVWGAGATTLVRSCLRRVGGGGAVTLPIDRLRYVEFVDGDEVIDDVVALRIGAGRREVVELQAHGGVAIVERILSVLASRGAVVVESLDDQSYANACNLIELEILRSLSAAKTKRAARFLARQKGALVELLESLATQAEAGDVAAVRDQLRPLLDASAGHLRLVNGATIVIAGPPNAGKSTLLNRLAGGDRAMVSEHAGTTRDWVSWDAAIEGVPVTLVDTAGVRTTFCALEEEAIRRGAAQSMSADLVVLLFDGTHAVDRALIDAFRSMRSSAPLVVALNKSDLSSAGRYEIEFSEFDGSFVRISALMGAGLDQLNRMMMDGLGVDGRVEGVGLFTRRQREIVAGLLSDESMDGIQLACEIRRSLNVSFGGDAGEWEGYTRTNRSTSGDVGGEGAV